MHVGENCKRKNYRIQHTHLHLSTILFFNSCRRGSRWSGVSSTMLSIHVCLAFGSFSFGNCNKWHLCKSPAVRNIEAHFYQSRFISVIQLRQHCAKFLYCGKEAGRQQINYKWEQSPFSESSIRMQALYDLRAIYNVFRQINRTRHVRKRAIKMSLATSFRARSGSPRRSLLSARAREINAARHRDAVADRSAAIDGRN